MVYDGTGAAGGGAPPGAAGSSLSPARPAEAGTLACTQEGMYMEVHISDLFDLGKIIDSGQCSRAAALLRSLGRP